jgi:hypothetical protein
VKAQLAMREAKLTSQQVSQLRSIAAPFADSLTRIEETIYQVQSRASEDPLNFPIRINNKISSLARTVDMGNARPTAQDYAVFKDLSAQLATELDALHRTLRGLDRVNEKLRSAGLTDIVPGTAELGTARSTSSKEL